MVCFPPELNRAVWVRGRARWLPCSSVQTPRVCSRVYVDVHVAMARQPGLSLGGPAHLIILFRAGPLGRRRDCEKVDGGNHGGSRRRHAGASRESYFWLFQCASKEGERLGTQAARDDPRTTATATAQHAQHAAQRTTTAVVSAVTRRENACASAANTTPLKNKALSSRNGQDALRLHDPEQNSTSTWPDGWSQPI
jgi:hypothetical protein